MLQLIEITDFSDPALDLRLWEETERILSSIQA